MSKIEAIIPIHRHDAVFVNIIGLPRTGKTTLAYVLMNRLREKGFEMIGEPIYDDYVYMLTNVLPLEAKERKIRRGVIILDDLTYHDEARSRKLGEALAKVAHYYNCEKLVVFTIFHYIHSVMPIVRLSHTRILTSITCRYEIELLRQYFDLDYLWEFYEAYVVNEMQYIGLVCREGKHGFIKWSKTDFDDYKITPRVKLTFKEGEVITEKEVHPKVLDFLRRNGLVAQIRTGVYQVIGDVELPPSDFLKIIYEEKAPSLT